MGTSTTFNYTYPTTSHRLASVSGPKARSFSYDANGSMTGNGSQQFVYNSLGRLHQVITALGTYQYRINGLGQRVMKIPPTGNRTIFHYDENGRLLAETDGLGVVVKEYNWHGATPVAIVLPPTSTKPERIYYIHADQLNTPRVVVNNSNAVLWRWDPEPFGTALPNEDVDGNGEKLVMNLRYPGQYYDQETGLNYNNFRDYDASIGRYIQSDPIGLAGGINTYTYVGGNPINWIDPLGLTPRGASIGGSIGAGVGSVLGGLIGGGGGTLVIPGVGTIGVGIAGAGQGAVEGAVIGAVIGDVVSDAIKGKSAANDTDYEQCPINNSGNDGCAAAQKSLIAYLGFIQSLYLESSSAQDVVAAQKAIQNANKRVSDHNRRCPNHKVIPLSPILF